MDRETHRSVGVLVVRVGNVFPVAPMEHVDLATDFGLRVPKGATNVFIETEERLLESFPDYPAFPGSRSGRQTSYYDNISMEIEGDLVDFFTDTGYTAVDVRSILAEADNDFSELTVLQIISLLQGTVDALLILEYLDRADLNSTRSESDEGLIASGFAAALFTYTMFDVEKVDTLFSYTPIMGFSLPVALTSDPTLISDEYIQKKVTIEVEGAGSSARITVRHELTKREVATILASQIIHGFDATSDGDGVYGYWDPDLYEMNRLFYSGFGPSFTAHLFVYRLGIQAVFEP